MPRTYLKFLDVFVPLILDGTKTMTARDEPKGDVGDIFQVDGHLFELTEVVERWEQWVAEHWREEGCKSREDWMAVWHLVQDNGYRPENLVWVHRWRPAE